MNAVDGIDKEELKQLLVRCWMTHDAMWFANALKEVGIETANRLNLGAIRSLAPIEVRRILRALGIDEVEDPDRLKLFLEGTMQLVGGDFMAFEWNWRPDGSLCVDVERCFAHEGITRLGAIEQYQCGIFERICAWLDALGIDYDIAPAEKRCMMHFEGRCHRDLRFRFDARASGAP